MTRLSILVLALWGCSSESANTTPDSGTGGHPSDAPTTATPDGGGTTNPPDAGTITGTGPIPPDPLPVVNLDGAACSITTPTTWTAAVYVVKCSLVVSAALTVNQGTVVKFDENASMTVQAQATIQALGSSMYPIVFTSLKDDAHGGDTNGDGAATTPAAGDWLGITVTNGNFGVQIRTSTFQACGFYYGGQSDRSTLLAAKNPSVAVFVAVNVKNSVFAHDTTHTDSLSAPPALDLRQAVGGALSGTTFFDNLVPVAVSTNVDVDDTNAFDDAGALPNKYNAIGTASAPFTANQATWAATQVPFIVGGLEIVANGLPPTLGTGVLLKFLPGGYFRLRTGTATSVTFTSIFDDAHGGDTNADGNATTPAAGDWDGVIIGKNGRFEGSQIFYAGGQAPQGPFGKYLGAALQIEEQGASGITVTNSTFAHNRSKPPTVVPTPAAILTGAGATITSNTFYDNEAPLAINTNSNLDDSNRFDNAGASPNDKNGVFVGGNPTIGQLTGPLAGTISWTTTRVPLVMGDTTISATGLLTLGDGVTMKFAKGTTFTIAQGGTLAVGSGDVFTSYLDDGHGGDTNGDGGANSPAANDWKGIVQFGSCATFATEFFETCQ